VGGTFRLCGRSSSRKNDSSANRRSRLARRRAPSCNRFPKSFLSETLSINRTVSLDEAVVIRRCIFMTSMLYRASFPYVLYRGTPIAGAPKSAKKTDQNRRTRPEDRCPLNETRFSQLQSRSAAANPAKFDHRRTTQHIPRINRVSRPQTASISEARPVAEMRGLPRQNSRPERRLLDRTQTVDTLKVSVHLTVNPYLNAHPKKRTTHPSLSSVPFKIHHQEGQAIEPI
jgi:hypothetical protein